MSRFTEKMYRNARPPARAWSPVSRTSPSATPGARCTSGPAGSRAAWPPPGVGHGDAVGVLAGFPVEIAPTAQGLWMRGASLTMLHQPTPRTDLVMWAEDTMNVIGMIEAKAVIVSEPFMAAIPVLEEQRLTVLTVDRPAGVRPDRSRSRPARTTSR